MRLIFNRIVVVIGLFFTSSFIFANNNVNITDTDSSTVILTVYGNAVCKTSIETLAISVENVSNASFDAENHQLTIRVYTSKFIENDLIFKLVSNGYDAGIVHAKDEFYNQLPEACKYVRMPDEVVRD